MRRVLLVLLLLLCACATTGEPAGTEATAWAHGFVFADHDGDGRKGIFERGLRGVAVSNGRDVVRTDWRGRWRLPADDDVTFFVVKPRGWMTPVDENGLPRFYRIHRPAGSPDDLKFPGVPPTGALPASIDFPLHRRSEWRDFSVLVFGDPQAYTLQEVDWLGRDVIAELAGTEALFGLSLGDLVGDDLALFEPLNRTIGSLGIPWYNVIGNHDLNLDAIDDAHSDETFERVYGPPTHAFQVGRVHFIVLDDVVYAGRGEDGASGPYAGGLTDDQLVFISGYLAGVRRSDLIVLVMHIPLLGPFPHQVPQRRELMEILSRHPNTLSLSAHMHMQQMHFLGPEDGWTRPEPHPHMNLGTTSGSWWRGAPDEQGIPHATMRCGAPNGYWIFEFDGNDYRARFKAARRPASYQMEIHAPDSTRENASSKTEVVVNFFAGSSHAELEMRVSASGPWLPLEHVERQDPGYAELFEREKSLRPPNGWGLPPRVDSPHIWAAKLPADLPPGTHWLEVRARDRFGAVHHARRPLRVLPAENSD
ncbi:MAG: calcineurin-like phosphoesterase family protein [Myxococcales bacterium]|nr:calcineurin-like phosphoesterase family protein [Myxococcales bacterium]